jgi:hypothetical protein
MAWIRYSSLFPYAKVSIWKLVPSGILTLICSVSCLLCRSKGRTYKIGTQTTDFTFLHSELLRPSCGDLRLELMACCQSGVSRMRRLKDNLGGTSWILCRGSARFSAGREILMFVWDSMIDLPGRRSGTGVIMSDCCLQGIQPCKCKGEGHR